MHGWQEIAAKPRLSRALCRQLGCGTQAAGTRGGGRGLNLPLPKPIRAPAKQRLAVARATPLPLRQPHQGQKKKEIKKKKRNEIGAGGGSCPRAWFLSWLVNCLTFRVLLNTA